MRPELIALFLLQLHWTNGLGDRFSTYKRSEHVVLAQQCQHLGR